LEKAFLVENEELKQMGSEGNKELGFVIEHIKKWLHNKYEKSFKLYHYTFSSSLIYQTIPKDVKSGKARFDKNILSSLGEKTISAVTKEEFDVQSGFSNNLYYYPEFEVAVAFYETYSGSTSSLQNDLYSADEKKLEKYIQHINKSYREKEDNYIRTFICRSYGVSEGKEKITNPVKREGVYLEEELKEEIFTSIDSFFEKDKDFFREFNLSYKRGIMLYGPPGNGKTTLTKSIVSSVDAPVAYWQITENTNSFTIEEVFEKAERLAPMVLVIEDIDTIPERAKSAFLNAMDGATSKEGIFVIATTNHPERIDPALINRPGRFDQTYLVDNPTEEIRLQYLKDTKITTIVTEEELMAVGKKTEGFSITQLQEFYKLSAMEWYYKKTLDTDKIIERMKRTNEKQKDNNWMKNSKNSQLGFLPKA